MYFVRILLILILSALAPNIGATSFNCARTTTKVEELICASSYLSVLDDKLAVVYQERLERRYQDNSGHRVKSPALDVRKQQRDWLRLVRNVCTDEACLVNAYEKRICELTPGCQVRIPKEALGTYTNLSDLRSLNPNTNSFEKYGEHEDYVKITEDTDGTGHVEIWVTGENSHICQFEGTGYWYVDHIEVWGYAGSTEELCTLHISFYKGDVYLGDPGSRCGRASCGARASLAGETYKKNAR